MRATPCARDRKSTRLNSSHSQISYAVFCLKKKKIVGQEHLLAVEVVPDPAQPLADRRGDSGLYERDRPVGDVRREQLDIAVPQDEVVGLGFPVVQEEVADVVCPVAEAEDELLVSEV